MNMENQHGSLVNWAHIYNGKTMEELRNSLFYATLELETTRLMAQEELWKRDAQLTHLKELLNVVIRERDEAQDKCQKLLVEKLLLEQQQQQNVTVIPATTQPPLSGVSSIEDEPRRGTESANNGFYSSECDESIVSSPVAVGAFPNLSPSELDSVLFPEKPLPEKGKLLQAVIKAGPLLQTLLLAGPLPQWRHPPPPLEHLEIPPVSTTPRSIPPSLLPDPLVANCGRLSRKRGVSEGPQSSNEVKFQRVALH
ncbi:hypothetical protein SAY87_012960 [Trapa incisa]|uniref:Uncharacterized protein n=1 Tax=Trapa incisa TaxID=236973 RepID=A0AAN7KH55_9MYRT|nr:hypothetical protein SAY87_012960 [Trapa incisa]